MLFNEDIDKITLDSSVPEVGASPEGVSSLDHDLESQVTTRSPLGAPAAIIQLDVGAELAGNLYRYRLVRKLGHGGFGSVYLAESLNGDGAVPEQVVLKFYHVPQTGDQRSLFRREISSLLALEHDRVISLFDWRFARNTCFLVLEYYPAGSLLDTEYFLGEPISIDTLERVIADILTALNAAHQASILHLDIKPANVLRDAAGGYVLTDFGISQGSLVSHHMVETGLGSPGYQAPEQRECNRKWVGPRTDLYGVGATAWALFTGQQLDQIPDFVALDTNHGSVLPPVSNYRKCPPGLENFIASMTSFNPTDRPGGAAEALALLRSASYAKKRITLQSAGLYQTGHPVVSQLVDNLVDPLWSSICSAPRPKLNYYLFKDEEVLCSIGEHAYTTYVLLSGTVRVELTDGRIIRESREGSFLGENATLTGLPRTATLIAEREVWALVFNAAEFEQFVVAYPAVAIRLIKTLALRCRMNAGFA